MTLHDASKEFELDCKVRHLSPKTIDNYTKQLRYLENHLSIEFSILNIKDVKPAHIKSFMAMMDDAGRKSQYINDLLKVFKTFFTYLEAEGYPKAGIRDNSCKQGKMLTFCTLLVGRLRPQSRGLPARSQLKTIHRIVFRALRTP